MERRPPAAVCWEAADEPKARRIHCDAHDRTECWSGEVVCDVQEGGCGLLSRIAAGDPIEACCSACARS